MSHFSRFANTRNTAILPSYSIN